MRVVPNTISVGETLTLFVDATQIPNKTVCRLINPILFTNFQRFLQSSMLALYQSIPLRMVSRSWFYMKWCTISCNQCFIFRVCDSLVRHILQQHTLNLSCSSVHNREQNARWLNSKIMTENIFSNFMSHWRQKLEKSFTGFACFYNISIRSHLIYLCYFWWWKSMIKEKYFVLLTNVFQDFMTHLENKFIAIGLW